MSLYSFHSCSLCLNFSLYLLLIDCVIVCLHYFNLFVVVVFVLIISLVYICLIKSIIFVVMSSLFKACFSISFHDIYTTLKTKNMGIQYLYVYQHVTNSLARPINTISYTLLYCYTHTLFLKRILKICICFLVFSKKKNNNFIKKNKN